MDTGIYMAASGSLKQEKMMEVVANNLANVNNDGFKRDLLAFEAVPPDFNETDQAESQNTPVIKGFKNPHHIYPTVATLKTDFSPGQIVGTESPLDMALEGKGFFVVQTQDGPRYLRSGSFRVNENRELTTPEGNLVMGDNGPISTLPPGKEITVDEKGQVFVGSGADIKPAGKLKIVDFPDYTVLEKAGLGFFRETGEKSTVRPTENVKVLQGALESSNVNVASEMVNMIEVTRGYESYQKVIHSIDSLNNKAVNEVSRIS